MTKSNLFRAILIASIGGAAMTVNTGAYAAHRDHDRWDHSGRPNHVQHYPQHRRVFVRERAVYYAPPRVVYRQPAYYYPSNYYANDSAIMIGLRIPPLVIPLY